MNWQFMLVMLVIVNTAAIVFNKIASDKLPKNKSVGIFYQYVFCASLGFFYAFMAQEIILGPMLIVVGSVGLINSFGSYFQWQAVGLSLSKTTLFFPLMEITTIILALVFLGESILWTPQLITGVIFCFLAMYLFRLPMRNKNDEETKKSLSRKWLLYVILMILIFGIASFLLKIFSFTITKGSFIMSWYFGAFLGSLLILLIEKANPLKLEKKVIYFIFPASLTMWCSLLALYWTYQLSGPVSIVLPIRGLAITLIPAFIGWQRLKEGKSFTKREVAGFIIGTLGAIMILLR